MALTPDGARDLLHELRVRQIELELQNEELRLAYERLELSRQHYSDLYDRAPLGYLTMCQSGIVREANRTAAGLLDHDASAMIGLRLKSFIHPNDRDRFEHESIRLFEAAAPRAFELRLTKTDGTVFPAWIEMVRHEGAAAALMCRLSLTNIAQRKQTEEQLRLAQRLETVGQLSGGIAHDLNNLLAVIIGNIEQLGVHGQFDRQGREFSDEALAAAIRGAELTHKLLAFARKQTLRPQTVDANRLLRDLSTLLHRTVGENIQVFLRLAEQAWPILVDPDPLEAAIINLANNARDAMPEGGELTIMTINRHLDEDSVRRFNGLQAGEYLMIEVSDSGVGIAPENLARVFEPFYTTKEFGRGMGLGLATVYGYVKQSGGSIDVWSKPGTGTTFEIYLPRARPAPSSDQSSPRGVPVRGTGQTVLVVEDNVLIRRLALRQITSLGYRVFEAGDADAALKILGDRRIDLVFSDVVMPGGADGITLAREVLRRWPATKIVLTSGYSETSLGDGIGSVPPAIPLLNKPYTRDALSRLLQGALTAASVERPD